MTRPALFAAAGLALLLTAGAALAAEPIELFVDGTFSGVIGPKLESPIDVRRAERGLGRTLGDFAEGQLGRKLSVINRERHNQAAATALWLTPGGTPVGWRNFRGRIRGEVTPEAGLFRNGELICRRYSERIALTPQDERNFKGLACWSEAEAKWSASSPTIDTPAR
jgi:surface antigen